MKQLISAGGIFLIIVIFLTGCSTVNQSSTNPQNSSSPTGKSKLVVFEADSLMVPFAEIGKQFRAANPNIDLEIQAHGSIQVIRHVTELGEDVDIVAVADFALIPLLMYQTPMENGQPFADWYIKPAANEMVLVYTPASKYATEINNKNWYQILSRPDVRIGLADPRMDVVGYRAIMTTKLAETYYNQPGIFQDTLGKHFTLPLPETMGENGSVVVTVPELLEPASDKMFLRGASMQLLSLHESNNIDYSFEYRSVAAQHKLQYLELPPEINLGNREMAEHYQRVKVKLDFRRFKSVAPLFEGLPIAYGLGIPANSQHREEAVKFLEFVLGQKGQQIFSDNFNPLLRPPECDNVNALPQNLQNFFR
jgi:molybdate/tungstate transport system substrate-binding protein